MNDVQHTALQAYARQLADQLLLRDWEITIERKYAAPPCQATCQLIVCRKIALIQVASDFWALPPDDQRQTMTHELIHPHFDQWRVIVDRLSGVVSDGVFTMHEFALRDVIEYGVDALATIIAPTLPLPVLPTGVYD